MRRPSYVVMKRTNRNEEELSRHKSIVEATNRIYNLSTQCPETNNSLYYCKKLSRGLWKRTLF